MFREPAWKIQPYRYKTMYFMYICKQLLVALYHIWEQQSKKNFIKYSIATKNKILGRADVSLYEHTRVKSWKAEEEKIYYS